MHRISWDELNPVINYANILKCEPEFQFGPRVITNHQFIYISKGRGTGNIQGRTYAAKKGDLFYYGPTITHSFKADRSQPFELYGLHFGLNESIDYSNSPFSSYPQPSYFNAEQSENLLVIGEGTVDTLNIGDLIPAGDSGVGEVIHQITLSYIKDSPMSAVMNRSLLISLFGLLHNHSQHLTDSHPHLTKVLNQIRTKLIEHATATYVRQWLSDWSDYNEDYLARSFQTQFGISPHHFHQVQKIEKAKELLTQTKLSITEIAELLHFDTVHYFSRVFKSRTGYTPTSYRTIRRML
ncbi:hypothetical protein A8709_00250 [Paenibacillus pectinilyticus]|uniref:HTH araC/xylS-type domain-containing protein n=1 Tax=Paenibacillus pectinilyticus TaxID=512399 RepID=A0A1C1A0U8_9BACL|nr:helix-turn-helix domain-containing protein [Paenibacillus pectinilyticus]OCT14006.1 hypothetical protein A8709_00250 [Paenibacillus pectinilyticus]